ncbi:MAG: hypothetical protein CO034_01115 [Parcubacteria group bacterium CG_4_9_14_0_2_um_filter_35_11]|nr:MAG: hypothetical protein CO034_01115 [Parcubacteria group bacterium CG_4_9_14_0_2_um_filter_35_11]
MFMGLLINFNKNMNKKQFKNCAIYTRVSTDLQAEKEFSSCASQEEKIRSFVNSQDNWQIYKVYSDAGYTGANTNRPALQELLEDVKQKKIDRLTRSPKDFYQLIEFFEQYGVDFISITERFDTSTPAGRLLRNIMLTFAQFERELTSERTKDKLLERAKKGFWHGGITPYGYKRENKRLVINKKEAEIIRLIFEKYLETGSITEVYDFLKEKNIKNRQGNLFRKAAIAFLLRNIVYAGKVKHIDKIYQGIHEPIISEEIFEMAQKIHRKKLKKFRVYRDFLFGGLVNCKECNFKMSPCFTNKYNKGKLERYYYYRCNSTHHKDWQSCPIKQVSADRLENYILENLKRISLDKDYIENLVFRLNHGSNIRRRTGYELTKPCSKFSPEKISSTLKSFLSILAQKKGMERNLLAKKFIEKIIYSKENIKISLFYSENLKNFAAQKSPVPPKRDGASRRSRDWKNLISAKNSQFEANNTAVSFG